MSARQVLRQRGRYPNKWAAPCQDEVPAATQSRSDAMIWNVRPRLCEPQMPVNNWIYDLASPLIGRVPPHGFDRRRCLWLRVRRNSRTEDLCPGHKSRKHGVFELCPSSPGHMRERDTAKWGVMETAALDLIRFWLLRPIERAFSSLLAADRCAAPPSRTRGRGGA